MQTNLPVPFDFCVADPSRGLLRDCTTGCGTDGVLHSSTRNKLWLYNEQMTLNDKPKPLAKTYAKWVEFTDAMAQQVPSDKNI